MSRGPVSAARSIVRERVPGAARAYRAYLRWASSHRSSVRRRPFERIARSNEWGDPSTISGPGSNLEQTEAVREELPKLWTELGIRRLADAPCGDFYWMSSIVENLDYYFGGDIVPDVVTRARERAPDWCEFRVFDLLTDEFPPVDAILIRDGLGVFSNRDAEAVLRNVARSSARYLLTTTHPDKPSQDVITGGWRPLNLSAPPLSLPEPLRLIDERCTLGEVFADKRLGVWAIADVRTALRDR